MSMVLVVKMKVTFLVVPFPFHLLNDVQVEKRISSANIPMYHRYQHKKNTNIILLKVSIEREYILRYQYIRCINKKRMFCNANSNTSSVSKCKAVLCVEINRIHQLYGNIKEHLFFNINLSEV